MRVRILKSNLGEEMIFDPRKRNDDMLHFQNISNTLTIVVLKVQEDE